MMRRQWSTGLLVGAFWTMSMPLGCGTDLECGATTVERDGQCVPAINECSAGTVLKDGKCVPDCAAQERWDGTSCVAIPKCGQGTTEVNGACVPSCEKTTYWNGSQCVPTPECAEGATFNAASGACEPDEGACATGSTWKNGTCVSDLECGPGTHAQAGECVPDTLPAADVTESADSDGAADFTVPDTGDTTILGGVIDEPLGFSFPDWDRFRFTAEGGTWLQIEAYSAGALHPAFLVQSDELGSDGTPRYVRYAMDRSGLRTRREIYIPFTGTYELRVTDYAQLLSSIFSSVQSIPVGGPDFGYAVEVQNLGTPSPQAVAALPATKTGDLSDGTLHFYSVAGLQAGDFVGVSSAGLPPPDTESDAFPAVMAFGPSGAFLGQNVALTTYSDAELPFRADAAGDYLVVQDHLLTIGDRDDFSLGLFALEPKDCTTGGCAAGSLPANGNELLQWDLVAGDFLIAGVYLPMTANEYVKVSLFGGDMQPALADSAASPVDVGVGYLYAAEPTTASLWLREWDGVAVPSYSVDARVIATPAVASGGNYTNLAVNEMPPYTLKDAGITHFEGKAGQMVFFSSFATHPDGAWGAPQELMMTPSLEPMGPVIDTQAWNFPDGFVTPLISYIKEDGHYLHYVFDGAAGFAGGTYDTRVSAKSTFALGTAELGTPLAASGHNLTQGMALYTFEGKVKQYSEIKVTPKLVSSMIPDLWVFNFGRAEFEYISYRWVGDMQSPRLGLIERKTATATEAVTIGYQSPYDGTTVLLVQTSTGSGTVSDSFDLSVTVPEPPGNDTCDTAGALTLDASGHAAFSWNSASATDSITVSGCTDYASDGPDVFFKVDLAEGDTLTVTEHSDEFSVSLYLFNDCQNVKATCRAGSEYGDPRTIVYKVPAGGAGTYVIGADSHVKAGWFDMDVQVTSN